MMNLLRLSLANAMLAGAVFAAGPLGARPADTSLHEIAGHDNAARSMPAGSFVSQRASERFWNEDIAGFSPAAPANAAGSFSSARLGSVDEMTAAGARYVHVEPSNCSSAADQSAKSCAGGKATARPAILPEAATWAMMILGFGIAGWWLRRTLLRSEAKFDARIKQIEADEPTV